MYPRQSFSTFPRHPHRCRRAVNALADVRFDCLDRVLHNDAQVDSLALEALPSAPDL